MKRVPNYPVLEGYLHVRSGHLYFSYPTQHDCLSLKAKDFILIVTCQIGTSRYLEDFVWSMTSYDTDQLEVGATALSPSSSAARGRFPSFQVIKIGHSNPSAKSSFFFTIVGPHIIYCIALRLTVTLRTSTSAKGPFIDPDIPIGSLLNDAQHSLTIPLESRAYL